MSPSTPSHALENQLGIRFNQAELLQTALTHRSFLNENAEAEAHNERLEFLGDAVLELVTTDFLFHKLPDLPEGKLTSLRAALVRKENLAKAARQLQLGQHLVLSRGEEQTGGRENSYLLANAVEALIGAIYLDQGLAATQEFIEKTILGSLSEILEKNLHRDAKSFLQEMAQEKRQLTPSYQIESESGPDHNKTFVAGVFFAGEKQGEGKGNSKRSAELKAAEDALSKLGWKR